VIRGKLVVIPIENSFLYVIPLYLQAEGTNFPQLKRVIVATGDKVVMEPTLDGALAALFGSQETPQAGTPQANGATSQSGTAIDQERAQLAAAQKAIDSLKNPARCPHCRKVIDENKSPRRAIGGGFNLVDISKLITAYYGDGRIAQLRYSLRCHAGRRLSVRVNTTPVRLASF